MGVLDFSYIEVVGVKWQGLKKVFLTFSDTLEPCKKMTKLKYISHWMNFIMGPHFLPCSPYFDDTKILIFKSVAKDLSGLALEMPCMPGLLKLLRKF